MKTFFKGLITGNDENASMAKVMSWIVLASILISWFRLERDITGLSMIFGALLGYTLGGKFAWKNNTGGGISPPVCRGDRP